MDDQLKRNLFEEITKHLTEDDRPSEYMNELARRELFSQYPFQMLKLMKTTEQSPKYHPEGNVWNHTMLVLDKAAKVRSESKDARAFMWAALLHDIGKPGTTRIKKDRITSYDHDKAGEKLSAEFLKALKQEDEEFIHRVASLVRYHMHILYVLKNLPYQDIYGLLQNVDIWDIALLCRCDRLGRTGAVIEVEEAEYREFLSRLRQKDTIKS